MAKLPRRVKLVLRKAHLSTNHTWFDHWSYNEETKCFCVVQKFGVSKIITLIQQRCIKLIKSAIEDIYSVTKDFYFS